MDAALPTLNQLRIFPRQQRELRLRFAITLRQRMGEWMGLIYGGMDKLGPLPLLIASTCSPGVGMG